MLSYAFTMPNSPTPLRFAPSRVQGLPAVAEVAVWPDRIEFLSDGTRISHRFFDIAQWPRPKIWSRLLFRLGVRPKWLPVADRDWFNPPGERYFEFYTTPSPIRVFMPIDEIEDYHQSNFLLLQQVLWQGGYSSYDLG